MFSVIYSDVCFCCCTASKRLTLPASDLLSIQPQLADSDISQSKLHVRVHSSCRIRLVEYFQIITPDGLLTDDVGKLFGCMQNLCHLCEIDG